MFSYQKHKQILQLVFYLCKPYLLSVKNFICNKVTEKVQCIITIPEAKG